MDYLDKEINRQGLDTKNNGWITQSMSQKNCKLPLGIIYSGEIKYDNVDKLLGLTRYFCDIYKIEGEQN